MFDVGPEGPAGKGSFELRRQKLSQKGTGVKGQSYKGQSYKGQSYKGQSYKGQSHKGQSYKGQSYKGQSYKGQSYKGQSFKGRSVKRLSIKGRGLKGVSLKRSLSKGLWAKLAGHGLDSQLMNQLGVGEDLKSPAAKQAFAFTVGCALFAEQKVEVKIGDKWETFKGYAGLAPQWGKPDGYCDEECQGWVSACLIANVNARDEYVPISMSGNHPSLDPEQGEEETYTEPDGVYYGQVFSNKPQFFACLPEQNSTLDRVCGSSVDDCFVEVMGLCSDVCDLGGNCLGSAGEVYEQTIVVHTAEKRRVKLRMKPLSIQ
jgi:hypothetical protein